MPISAPDTALRQAIWLGGVARAPSSRFRRRASLGPCVEPCRSMPRCRRPRDGISSMSQDRTVTRPRTHQAAPQRLEAERLTVLSAASPTGSSAGQGIFVYAPDRGSTDRTPTSASRYSSRRVPSGAHVPIHGPRSNGVPRSTSTSRAGSSRATMAKRPRPVLLPALDRDRVPSVTRGPSPDRCPQATGGGPGRCPSLGRAGARWSAESHPPPHRRCGRPAVDRRVTRQARGGRVPDRAAHGMSARVAAGYPHQDPRGRGRRHRP